VTVTGGYQGTTKDLVAMWRVYREVQDTQFDAVREGIIWAIETELAHRPVRERLDAGYPK
jgi:hypothetical protein